MRLWKFFFTFFRMSFHFSRLCFVGEWREQHVWMLLHLKFLVNKILLLPCFWRLFSIPRSWDNFKILSRNLSRIFPNFSNLNLIEIISYINDGSENPKQRSPEKQKGQGKAIKSLFPGESFLEDAENILSEIFRQSKKAWRKKNVLESFLLLVNIPLLMLLFPSRDNLVLFATSFDFVEH